MFTCLCGRNSAVYTCTCLWQSPLCGYVYAQCRHTDNTCVHVVKCVSQGLLPVVQQISYYHFLLFSTPIQALDKMESEWESVDMEILSYKETGTYIMKIGEEVGQQLDDHIVMTQAMSFSPYKKPFEMRIATWENKLRITQDVMEEWWVGHGGVAGGSKWCIMWAMV